MKTAGITMLVVGGLVAAMAVCENDAFQFCTTKAYGWPTPWRIVYCECEGGRTIYPASSAAINLGLIPELGFVAVAVSNRLSSRRRESSTEPAEPVNE